MRPLILLLTVFSLVLPVMAQQATLPETYVSDDETTTLRYPSGWFVDYADPGMVLVATNPDLFDLGDETVPSGEAAVAVVFATAENQFLDEMFIGDDPVAILELFIDSIFSSESDFSVEFTTPAPTVFGSAETAARADGLFLGNHVFIIVASRDADSFSIVVGITAEADHVKYEPKLLAIAESVNYLPPAR